MAKPPKRPIDPYIGETIGSEFTIIKHLGAGGMGTVYRATQDVTLRSVAIKMLHRHLLDEMLIRRFEQEAQIIAKLNHPNIVTVYKYGQHEDGGLYIAMEFVNGIELADAINTLGPFSLERALPLMQQMADALAFAHEHRIVHRDIKPENMILSRRGRSEQIKILDFGIAKILDDNFVKTQTGMLVGSPGYMSPEQWKQVRDIDGRADIYSLGCVFFSLLTGQLPFQSDSAVGFMTAHLNDTPPDPQKLNPDLEELPEVSKLILKCIARERSDRFQDTYELSEALRELQHQFELSRRRAEDALDVELSQTIHSTRERESSGSFQSVSFNIEQSALEEVSESQVANEHLVAAARAKSRSSNLMESQTSGSALELEGDNMAHRLLIMTVLVEMALMSAAIVYYW